MKSLSALALASLAFASACATGGSLPGAVATAASAPGTKYCWKHRLVPNDGELACNWAPSAAEACRLDDTHYIPQKSVESGPKDAGRCTNGQWLVSVTTR